MKNKNIELNYNNFDSHKFIRMFKCICESSIFVGRFKITQKDKKLIENYRTINQYLKSLVRNPIIFENDIIYAVLTEIESFISLWNNFKNIIQNVSSIDGLIERQTKFIEYQQIVINHLKEINDNPTKVPFYLQNENN